MQSVPITTKIVNSMSICLDILAFPIWFLFNNVFLPLFSYLEFTDSTEIANKLRQKYMVYLNFQMYKTYVDVKNGFAIEGFAISVESVNSR
jgi:hypothetical protein